MCLPSPQPAKYTKKDVIIYLTDIMEKDTNLVKSFSITHKDVKQVINSKICSSKTHLGIFKI